MPHSYTKLLPSADECICLFETLNKWRKSNRSTALISLNISNDGTCNCWVPKSRVNLQPFISQVLPCNELQKDHKIEKKPRLTVQYLYPGYLHAEQKRIWKSVYVEFDFEAVRMRRGWRLKQNKIHTIVSCVKFPNICSGLFWHYVVALSLIFQQCQCHSKSITCTIVVPSMPRKNPRIPSEL